MAFIVGQVIGVYCKGVNFPVQQFLKVVCSGVAILELKFTGLPYFLQQLWI
jgi:hypothetical protein